MDTYGDIEFQSGKLLQNGKNFGIEVVDNSATRDALIGVEDGTVIMTADDHVLNIYNSTSNRWNKIRNFTVAEVNSPTSDPTQLYVSDVRSMLTDINNCNTFLLPQAIVGYEFTFYKTKTVTFRITANGTDTIDNYTHFQNASTEIYVSTLIKCVTANKWIIVNQQGSNWVSLD
ncbi:MAG: hypothetical protein DRI57_00255 [Deltaproteobacteria bacterium]|nr:MAG: hypothetical protein DRI57_00255 [Deltaproteobacteria bacterium]